jgi:ATP-dependent RNA helicase RhlE
MNFQEFNFSDLLLKTVGREGYKVPTKIQEMAIPHVLAGKDVMGCAQTGTGKTAAFALPILERMSQTNTNRGGKKRIRVLALAPTRELASQIKQSFVNLGTGLGFRSAVIYGGVGYGPQTRALTSGIDILVATPGRLLDLMNQGYVDLSTVEFLVLDEADRMLDMGFIHDIRQFVAATPKTRQSLLFSATLPHSIHQLAKNILNKPITVNVKSKSSTVEAIDQSVFFVERNDKIGLLVHLLGDDAMGRALVFTKTKHGADNVVRKLMSASIPAVAIHGNKSQNKREQALGDFKRGKSRVLVATDIASRGLDIEQVTHVVNFDLPNEPESYIHRIGRTGRAGASGIALSFCGRDERSLLNSIERLIRQRLDVQQKPQFSYVEPRAPRPEPTRPQQPNQRPARPARPKLSNGRPARNSGRRSNNWR